MGEMFALLREHNKVKSTLMSILGGMYEPDEVAKWWKNNCINYT